MSEFKRVVNPVFQPRKCALCNSFEGPMIDTHLDVVGHGHLYLCAATEKRPGCVRQLARLDDMADGDLIRKRDEEIKRLRARVEELESRKMEFVSVDDVREAIVSGVFSQED